MMAKQVMNVLHADGRIEANLQGYHGKECDQEQLLDALQTLLTGGGEMQKKPEYFQVKHQQQTQGR